MREEGAGGEDPAQPAASISEQQDNAPHVPGETMERFKARLETFRELHAGAAWTG
jgi:hypothetical protein